MIDKEDPSATTCSACGASTKSDQSFCGDCGAGLQGKSKSAPRSDGLPDSIARGRYKLEELLGEGGRKRVYLAQDNRLDRKVAIALIKTEDLDEGGRLRVLREAQAMARLGDHPNVVTVYDIGEERNQPYIVSEYMPGGSVHELLDKAQERRLPTSDVLRLGKGVCAALEYAHASGIIHRDLKPQNIWLTGNGDVKLGDFGLAVALNDSRLTVEGMMVGTVAYMPPEFALGRPPEGRSDLYSLGAVLYEMVTGHPPFLGDDAVGVISQHINTSPVAPSWHNHQVPRALETLILHLLAKIPEDRPSSASEVTKLLTTIEDAAFSQGPSPYPADPNPLDRLEGGVFVGRSREMEQLRAAVDAAVAGRGGLLLLVGEPGIGKTRTSDALATYAGLRGGRVLVGRSHEDPGAPAYWPWLQVIRSYIEDHETEALVADMGPGAADIGQVVPEVRERIPGLPESSQLEPEQARFRLFDSVASFFKKASSRQPIIIILDDLHAADRPSLLLLQFVASQARNARLLILGTYRDVELRRQHPLSQTLAELARAQIGERVLLRGLTEQDVARFIELSAGITPPGQLINAVYRQTEGNPLFVSEIVRLLVAEGRLDRADETTSWSVDIPQSVREVIGLRLDRLSEDSNAALTTASVIGRTFDLDVLQRVSETTRDQLLEALEEAIAAKILLEEGGPLRRASHRYSFSHALIRETLYEELTTTRRVRLHQKIAEVLEAVYAEDLEPHFGELAYHYFESTQSGDVEKAIDYAVRAGQLAIASLAYEEAAAHYDRALQADEELKQPSEGQRVELLLALGDAQGRGGDTARARDSFLRAAAAARTRHSTDQLVRAALGLAGSWTETGVTDPERVALLEESLESLGREDRPARTRVLARLAQELYWSGNPERSEQLSREAVEIARRLNDPGTLAFALGGRHYSIRGLETLEERLVVARELVDLADAINDREVSLQGRQWLLVDLLEMGDMRAVDREIAATERLAKEIRQPLYLWWTAVVAAMRCFLDGRLDEGEQRANQALGVGQHVQPRNALQFYAIQMLWIGREQGRVREVEAAAREFIERYPNIPSWRAALAELYTYVDDRESARREFEYLAVDNFDTFPRDTNWLIGICLLSKTAAFLGDIPRINHLYDLLLPYAGRNVMIGRGVACEGSASHYLGILASAAGRWDDAMNHFEEALTMNARLGARVWIARTQHAYAEMLISRDGTGDRARALALLSDAIEAATEMQLTRLVEACLALKLIAQGAQDINATTSLVAIASSVQMERPDLRTRAGKDGTVSILFSDMEDSTLLLERLGDQQWLELLRIHNSIIRDNIRLYDGFEVKSQGDGFMISFQSSQKAVLCAISIQRELAKHNQMQSNEPIRVRIGIHAGEVLEEAGDFFGKTVVLAARIAALGAGNEILVSERVKELTKGAVDENRFVETREVTLKGLFGNHHVSAVAWWELE